MALTPVTRRSVPDEVYEQIVEEMVSGDLSPGHSLPSERRLAEVLGVSRPAVREALQRLAHAGFVEVRQGDATTVRDFRRSGGLDLLPQLLMPRGDVDLAVVRSILEARLHNGPKIAALAAERSGAALRDKLHERLAELEQETDPVTAQVVALSYWDLLVDGADSVVFRLMFNSLRAAYEPALSALGPLMSTEVSRASIYRRLTAAVVAADPDAAAKAAELLLGPATAALLAAITMLEVGL